MIQRMWSLNSLLATDSHIQTLNIAICRFKNTGKEDVQGSVRIKNTGKMEGEEVVQVYVKPINPSVNRPVHELKFFKKIRLKPGEEKTVNFTLCKDAFSYYDVHLGNWVLDKCKYEIEIGKNSRSILLTKAISLKNK
jgi:beta-glucosidase